MPEETGQYFSWGRGASKAYANAMSAAAPAKARQRTRGPATNSSEPPHNTTPALARDEKTSSRRGKISHQQHASQAAATTAEAHTMRPPGCRPARSGVSQCGAEIQPHLPAARLGVAGSALQPPPPPVAESPQAKPARTR